MLAIKTLEPFHLIKVFIQLKNISPLKVLITVTLFSKLDRFQLTQLTTDMCKVF